MRYGYGTYGDLNSPYLREISSEDKLAHFEKHFQTWLEGSQAICDENHQERFPMLTRPVLTVKKGRRYIKIIRSDPHSSVHAFVDKNGDILKPASWKAPAKHARGNIFDDENGLASMGEYGPAYLR